MLAIGISGGSGAGKTTFVKKLIEKISKVDIAIIPQDRYYKDHSHVSPDKLNDINFDHPDAIDFNLLINHLKMLKKGESIEMPEYSFVSCKRLDKTTKVFPKSMAIVEGILAFATEEIRELLDIKIFLDCDADTRLSRMIMRDVYERERSFSEVLRRYERTVKPMHIKYVDPSRRFADLIIPGGVEEEVNINFAVSMITNHLLKKMK